ncbi:MAG: malto-oligosyltrehalose synthase [Mycobacteriales bacterium]
MPTPRSTYRVQVSPRFDLDATAELADYLADLGVTHLYASPLLASTPGSNHGYDVVDHLAVDEQRGGEAARQRLLTALRAQGLGMVLDIVPNHMGVAEASANNAWWDVLWLGAQSAYAHWFEIDWSRGRLVLPVLGDAPDELDRLRIKDGELRYYEHRFPLGVGTSESGTPREIHDRQHYRLVSWRRADTEVNYRRFFAVATLAGIRVEEPDVFDTTHTVPLRWARAGEIDGIRIDHPDGLADPAGYLQHLAAACPEGIWLVVEKILEPGEALPDWPIAGTTGYDALGEVDRLLADVAADGALLRAAGTPSDWPELVHESKLDVATGMLRAELDRLTTLAPDVEGAGNAVAELLACFPVYRSYLPGAGAEHLAIAVSEALRRRPDLAAAIRPVAAVLADPDSPVARRFQQQTGAVMAKGVEDTAYYRYTHFIAATEVGADPTTIGWEPADFHAAMVRRHANAPDGMTTLSTHDTKRGEDVRARLAVLTEIPGRWAESLRRWESVAPLSDPSVAALLWQTVVGSWPIERDRLHAAMEKSAREARTGTSWNAPDAGFEAAMHAVIDRVYDDAGVRADIESLVETITAPGWSNSLAAKLIQLTMPGVPDVYQGSELWGNSLVDPDNRRPVDFAHRRGLLAAIDGGERPPVDATGAAKLLVVATALRLRRDRPEAFSAYRPLEVSGPAARHAVAFDRGELISVATRLPLTLAEAGGFGSTAVDLPAGGWVDRLTGTRHDGAASLGDLTARYPVALLTPA